MTEYLTSENLTETVKDLSKVLAKIQSSWLCRKKEGAPFLLSPIPSPLFLHSPPLPSPPPHLPLLMQVNSLKAFYSGTPPYGHLVNTANFFWPNGCRINVVPL